jgi:hypothetical protein
MKKLINKTAAPKIIVSDEMSDTVDIAKFKSKRASGAKSIEPFDRAHVNTTDKAPRRVSPKGARQKGARGERELFALIEEKTGLQLDRNLQQSRNGGQDATARPGTPPLWLAVEVKRQESLNLSAWWEQAKSQSKPGQLPVLFFRQSRKPWQVITFSVLTFMGARHLVPVSVSLEHFLTFVNKVRDKLEIDTTPALDPAKE